MKIFLICVGVLGGLPDVLLHFLQLSDKVWVGPKVVAWVTLLSCSLVGLSLIWAFNAGAAIIMLFVGIMAVYALVTGKECH